MSLLDGEPRSATVKAETDLRLLVIDRTHFWRLLREVPGLTEKILVTLSRRVRQDEKPLGARRTGGRRHAPLEGERVARGGREKHERALTARRAGLPPRGAAPPG